MSFIAAKKCSKGLVRIILVLPVVDFILCFKKKDLNGREIIFKEIYELSDILSPGRS